MTGGVGPGGGADSPSATTQPAQLPSDASARQPRKDARHNLFSTMLDAMTDGVMVVDDKLRVVVTNRALREVLLLPPGSHGQPLGNVLHEPRLGQAFERVLGGGGPCNVEFEHRGLQNRVLDVLVVPLPDHVDYGHRALGVFRDVTERRELDRMLMDFIANASHELRTPTTAILGYAETLAETPPSDPETLHRFHQTVYRHAQRLSSLLGQLLDLTRLDANTYRMNLEAIDLRTVLQTAVEQQQEMARDAGLSVHLSAPAHLPAVWADRGAIEIVVGNLLQNAIKYTPPAGGRVEVRARVDGTARVRISVIDSGIGISAEDQRRVFERFYRVDRGRSRQMGGVGLGLSLVKTLVDHLGGKLELSSAVGKGSTFSVILPRAPA